MTPGRTADSANGSMTTSRWICQSGSTLMGRSSLKETRMACSLLVRVSDYDATPGSGHGATEQTRGASVVRGHDTGDPGRVSIPAYACAACRGGVTLRAGPASSGDGQPVPRPGRAPAGGRADPRAIPAPVQ